MDTVKFSQELGASIKATPKKKGALYTIDAVDHASWTRELARSLRNRCAEELPDGTIAMRPGYAPKVIALIAKYNEGLTITASDVDVLYGKALERLAMPTATRSKVDIDAIVAAAVAKALAEYKASGK